MKPRSRAAAILPFVVSIASVLIAGEARQNAGGPDADVQLVGHWRGESVCVVRESACHDEDSLYHVARLPEKPDGFSLKADKIVDGKPVTMGTVECSYDGNKKVLTCGFSRGVIRFIIENSKMTGTMTLPDGTLWRRIRLKRSAP